MLQHLAAICDKILVEYFPIANEEIRPTGTIGREFLHYLVQANCIVATISGQDAHQERGRTVGWYEGLKLG